MKYLLTMIMVLALGVSIMAQDTDTLRIKTIDTNTTTWEDLNSSVVIDKGRLDFYYPGHHLIVNTVSSTFVSTTDAFGNNVAMWSCDIINNNIIQTDMLFTIVKNDFKTVFMLMSQIEGDEYYIAFTVVDMDMEGILL